MSTKRGTHPGVGTIGVVGAAVLVTLLAACSSGGGGGGAAGGSVAAVPTDQAKARAVLAESRTELHTLVDSLAATASVGARAPFVACALGKNGIPPVACTGYDAAAPCATDTGSGPQRWGYNINLHVSALDAVAAGNAVLGVLKASQWKATQHATSANLLDVQAVKNDTTVRVVTDDLPGVLNIEGYGPCVSSAGTTIKG